MDGETEEDFGADGASPLQIDLARRILQRLRQTGGAAVGARVSAPELARSFGVSRSPVSAALDLLVARGVLAPMENARSPGGAGPRRDTIPRRCCRPRRTRRSTGR
jgi:DNA-binding transcriptional MocR family regulator